MRIARFFPATYHVRLRLRTVFLIVSLVVLLLPLGGVFFFRIYENGLVRQTEMELIAQAAVLASAYEQDIIKQIGEWQPYGIRREQGEGFDTGEYYTPIDPQLDLANDPTLPPRPDGKIPAFAPDVTAQAAGGHVGGLMLQAQRFTLAGFLMLDHNGIAVAGRSAPGLSFAHVPEVQTALRGQYKSVIRTRVSDEPPPAIASISRGTGIRVFIAYPVVHKNRVWGVVYLSRTPQNILKHLNSEKGKVFLAAATMLGMTLLLVWFMAHTVARPVNALIEKTRRVSQGDVQAMEPLVTPGTRELEILSYNFSAMAKSLHQRNEYIREFATHVSHEFKTPLTGIRGAAELLLEHADDMDNGRRERFLTNIIDDTVRLKQLVTRLLELARADNISPSGETTHVETVLEALSQRYGKKLHMHGDGDIRVLIPADHLQTILVNLLDNAYQHEATRVDIRLALLEEKVEITVTDNGKGVSPANREKIFTPFFTTRREEGGTGLGLGIVRSLLEAHGGSISLMEQTSGARFCLQIKRVQHG